MVFRYSLQFLFALLEQLETLLVTIGRENFQNLNDVVTDVFPEADVKLFKRK